MNSSRTFSLYYRSAFFYFNTSLLIFFFSISSCEFSFETLLQNTTHVHSLKMYSEPGKIQNLKEFRKQKTSISSCCISCAPCERVPTLGETGVSCHITFRYMSLKFNVIVSGFHFICMLRYSSNSVNLVGCLNVFSFDS